MNTMNDPGTKKQPVAPRIVGVTPANTNTALLLECGNCQSVFESLLRTVSGLPFGAHRCGFCGKEYRPEPAEVVEALERCWPVRGHEEAAAKTAEMVEIASRWHQSPAWASALTYRGVNLGACMQVDLFPYLATGLTTAAHSNEEA